MNDSARTPTASVTNLVLLRLFELGWEDPGWGQMPVNQVALGLALYDISSKLSDKAVQAQVQEMAQKVVAENAQLAIR